MTKHTPGPWKVYTVLDEVDQIERQVIAVSMGPCHAEKHVAHICTWGGSPEPEATANAKLIAAAPQLLAACQEVFDWLDQWYDGAPDSSPLALEAGRFRDNLQYLIEKATGGESPEAPDLAEAVRAESQCTFASGMPRRDFKGGGKW